MKSWLSLFDAFTDFGDKMFNAGLHEGPVKWLPCKVQHSFSSEVSNLFMQFFNNQMILLLGKMS